MRNWDILHDVKNTNSAKCCACQWNTTTTIQSESIDQSEWPGDLCSSTYRFISWDHCVSASFSGLPKHSSVLSHPPLGCEIKKRGKFSQIVVSHVLRVQPTSSCSSYLCLTIRPKAVVHGWRQGAVHGAEPGYRGGRNGGRRGQVLHPRPSFGLSHEPWTGFSSRGRSDKHTAAVDATLKLAADSSHVCQHEPRAWLHRAVM